MYELKFTPVLKKINHMASSSKPSECSYKKPVGRRRVVVKDKTPKKLEIKKKIIPVCAEKRTPRI